MRNARLIALVVVLLIAACDSRATPARQAAAGRDEAVTFAGRPDALSPAAAQATKVSVAGYTANEDANAPGSALPGGALFPETLTPSMIIRTGTASIEVDSLRIGIARVRQLAIRVGGFVANTSIQAGVEQGKNALIEIRLPSSRFDDAIAGLEPIGKLEVVNVSAEDVGEEYVDVQARVANARRLEQRLIEVLATRTGKLSDILNVEREIARVREEIERMEGRMRYLRTRTAISTLTITVHESMPIVGERGSWSVIGDAFAQAWRNFIAFVARFIAALGTLIPTALAVLAAIAGALAIWRKRLPRAKAE